MATVRKLAPRREVRSRRNPASSPSQQGRSQGQHPALLPSETVVPLLSFRRPVESAGAYAHFMAGGFQRTRLSSNDGCLHCAPHPHGPSAISIFSDCYEVFSRSCSSSAPLLFSRLFLLSVCFLCSLILFLYLPFLRCILTSLTELGPPSQSARSRRLTISRFYSKHRSCR